MCVCVAEDDQGGRVPTAACVNPAHPMEIVSSNSESAGDEDEDQHNQHRSKKPAAITSRQAKRALKESSRASWDTWEQCPS